MFNENRIRIWRGFWQLADPKIWIASTVPMAVAAALAYGLEGKFNLYWFFWSLLGVYLIEIGKNAVNEFVDYESGVDTYVTPDKRTPFSGGKKVIVDGILSLSEVKVIATVTMIIAGLVGIYVVFAREPEVLWIGVAGFVIAVFYSLPPAKLCYRGFGEFAVGLTFGPLVLCGTYLVQTHNISLEAVLSSLILGLLIANVLWINQFPDYEADLRGQKRNWVVRMGKKKATTVFAALFIAAFALSAVLAFIAGNPFFLLPLSAFPLARRAVDVARRYYDDIPRLIEANAKTVQAYQLTGLTLMIGALLNKFL
ncbi:prenyltransferase [Thermosediminibacter litoriperuensis]|uniref:1,4-dihydroxy-2-naphthoate prenyltransferase n=1 Tax=Thermosediminibacter litoriperuensis TaxID=291989 RepID=A0A5S5AWU8_9FIRM|nr:prenyltransferase [Thermosediminibacter litoriperuensis]TYP57838.1 1,4-dihydroxy-2-naphthoate prenyltransferase [Thermosediminibacter litoriperuensis]